MDPLLRNKIISEAYKSFIIKGIKNTSLNDITKSANKSKGALMYYFPSKNDLVRTVIDTCFFPASQIPREWDAISQKGYYLFLQIYQNPIERVIRNFTFSIGNNKFMAYMQFVASAHEYIDDFSVNYKQLWTQEHKFLKGVIQNAVNRGELLVTDIELYQKQFFELSIGKTFSGYLSQNQTSLTIS